MVQGGLEKRFVLVIMKFYGLYVCCFMARKIMGSLILIKYASCKHG